MYLQFVALRRVVVGDLRVFGKISLPPSSSEAYTIALGTSLVGA
jgi:hypothetical protein